jgi:hypothetical protein
MGGDLQQNDLLWESQTQVIYGAAYAITLLKKL